MIVTKYVPATDTEGAKVKAVVEGGTPSITLPWRGSTDSLSNHKRAAVALRNIIAPQTVMACYVGTTRVFWLIGKPNIIVGETEQ